MANSMGRLIVNAAVPRMSPVGVSPSPVAVPGIVPVPGMSPAGSGVSDWGSPASGGWGVPDG